MSSSPQGGSNPRLHPSLFGEPRQGGGRIDQGTLGAASSSHAPTLVQDAQTPFFHRLRGPVEPFVSNAMAPLITPGILMKTLPGRRDL